MSRIYRNLFACALFLFKFCTGLSEWEHITRYHLTVYRLAVPYPEFFELSSLYASEVSTEVGLPVRIYSASVTIKQSEFEYLFPKISIRGPVPVEVKRNITHALNYGPHYTWEKWMDYISVFICPTQNPWEDCGETVQVYFEVNTTECSANEDLCPNYHDAHCTFSKQVVQAAQKVFHVVLPLPSQCVRNFPIEWIISFIVIVVIVISLILFIVLKKKCGTTKQETQESGFANPSYEREETTGV